MDTKNKSQIIIIAIILFLIINNFLHSECKLLWKKIYDNGGNDYAKDMIIINNSYLYVTGYSYNGANNDFCTIKYTLNGNSIWTERFDNGSLEVSDAITGDKDGNIYVAGWVDNGADNDYYVVKYDSNGNTIWTQRYNSGGDDEARDIVVDNNYYVYVCGKINNNYASLKYDSGWNIFGMFIYNGSDYGITYYNDNIYITGYLSGTNADCLTIKYDLNGNTIWTQRYDSGNIDYAFDIANDNQENTYITGTTYNGVNNDILIIKYDNNGNLEWVRKIDKGGTDYGTCVTVENKNNGYLYVGGFIDNGSNYDYYIIKYDSNGNSIWTQRYDSGNDDRAYAIKIDNDGYIYITGYIDNGSNNDYCTIKYEQPLYPSYFNNISAACINNYIEIKWNENIVNERGFKIYRSYDNINYTLIDTLKKDSKLYIDNNIKLYTNIIYYKIIATNSINSISTTVKVNLYKNYSINEVVIVPNPYNYNENNGYIRIYNISKGMKIELYNINGEKLNEITIDEEEKNKIDFDLTKDRDKKLCRGIYILKIKDKNENKRLIPLLIK